MPVLIQSGRFGSSGPTLRAQWDFSDSGSVTLSTTKITQVNDLSGNGFHMLQAVDANRLTYTTAGQNGLNCATSDGSSRFMSVTGAIVASKPATIIIVGKNSVNGGRMAVLSNLFVYRGSNQVSIFNGSAFSNSTNFTESNADIVTAIFNGASSSIGLNAAAYSTGNSGSNTVNTTNVLAAQDTSGTWSFTGTLCEVRVYAGAITDADRITIEAALKSKWGTP